MIATNISSDVSHDLRLGDEGYGRPPVLAQHHLRHHHGHHGHEGPPHLASSENTEQHCLGAGMRTIEAIVLCVNTTLATGCEAEQGTVWLFRQGHLKALTTQWINQVACAPVTRILLDQKIGIRHFLIESAF